ncbi:MAG: 50S ribosomal protein L4 [Nanoarchaeota archaeon]|nr:50S ribosomal protein L4 [Nanoarchaeota archaeon]
MNVKIKTIKGTEKGSIELPKQFNEAIRPDIINRAFKAFRSHNFQPYGADPRSGMKCTAYLSKRRHKYRGTYGIGWSRTPRKIVSRRGTRINYRGAEAPQTVGGRRAHPPKADKKFALNINKKEKRFAIRSAMTASLNLEFLKLKNYKAPEGYPFVIEDAIQNIARTKDLENVLSDLKIETYLARKIRAGMGKLRGRKYVRKKGPLFVITDECELFKSANNLNIDVVKVENLNVNLLAPGGDPGRVTLFTEGAIKKLTKENLFYDNQIKKSKSTDEVKQ